MLFLAISLFCVISSANPAAAASAIPAGKNQHLLFGKGTPQELEVYKIFGRTDGPTVMLLGGIHGDEPGAYLSADQYANARIKRGNLIIVPRANFRSILDKRRGNNGDMNRKFAGTFPNDPEKGVVDILKSLMAESDALLTLHDGSGFYRPEWVSPMLNPQRYGQSIVADAAAYTVPASGKTIELQQYAERVLQEVNKEIHDPQYAFRFFNTRTTSDNSLYKEHRKSASYYALTVLGIPAFCIETSHNLPDLETKVFQHNLVINAFLNLFGIEFEQPGLFLETPKLSYLVISVDNTLFFAVPDKQTLLVPPGAQVEIADLRANYERGIMVAVQGLDAFNPLHRPFTINQKTTVSVRKDTFLIGQIDIAPLPGGESFPRIAGNPRIVPLHAPTPASLPPDPSPQGRLAVAVTPESERQPANLSASAQAPSSPITGFLLEVDGKPMEVKPGGTLSLPAGSLIKLVDFVTGGASLPAGVVMNLVGFVPKGLQRNTGDDRGVLVDTAKDLQLAYSERGKGEVYAVQAEQGRQVLAACSIQLVQPRLASVTLRFKGNTKVVEVGKRISIPSGTPVEILSVTLAGSISASNLRLTLGGHPVAPALPQTCVMRDIALNLAVFNGNALAGKVTWVP